MYLDGYFFLTSDISKLIENEMVRDHHRLRFEKYIQPLTYPSYADTASNM